MRRFVSRISLFVSVLGAVASVGGCSSSADPSQQEEAAGTLRLPLRGFGASGTQYRLRQALISVTGPTARLYDTETDPDQFGLFYELPAGTYEVKITGQTGENTWQLERVNDDGTFTNVNATIVPPNPVTVDVLPNGQAFANLQFVLNEDDVVFGTGQLFINLSVEDRPQCEPFVSPTGCLTGQKCLSAFNIPDVALCTAAGAEPTGGPCVSDDQCADGRCWTFADGTGQCFPDCLPTAAPGEAGSCPAGGTCNPITTSSGQASFGTCSF
jgi:hypothetical protein